MEQDSQSRYVTRYPNKYVNYGEYRYDALLETRKDRAIFDKMKDHFGDKEFWGENSYFSIDYFFTDEQTQELKKLFDQIKEKARAFAVENKGKDPGDMKFRQIKYYNMTLSIILIASLMLFVASMMGPTAFAFGGGGNDPTAMRMSYSPQPYADQGGFLRVSESESLSDSNKIQPLGGGGIDPTTEQEVQRLAQNICDSYADQDQALAALCTSATQSTTDSEALYLSLEILLHHYIQ